MKVAIYIRESGTRQYKPASPRAMYRDNATFCLRYTEKGKRVETIGREILQGSGCLAPEVVRAHHRGLQGEFIQCEGPAACKRRGTCADSSSGRGP